MDHLDQTSNEIVKVEGERLASHMVLAYLLAKATEADEAFELNRIHGLLVGQVEDSTTRVDGIPPLGVEAIRAMAAHATAAIDNICMMARGILKGARRDE